MASGCPDSGAPVTDVFEGIAENDKLRLQEVIELSKEMKDKQIGAVIKTLTGHYTNQGGVEKAMTEQEFFDTAKQTALLFDHIFDKAKVEEQSVLVFLGATGTGKSTTISILQGATVETKTIETGRKDEYDDPITEERHVLSGEYEKVVSENITKSATILPKCMGHIKELPGWTIWDFPGFEDTRSKAFNIGIASGYKSLLKRAKLCCLVMCCGPATIAGRNEIRATIHKMQSAVPAPGKDRPSKCFVSLNYAIQKSQLQLAENMVDKLKEKGIQHYRMDLEKLAERKPVRDKYIVALKHFLGEKGSAIDPKNMDFYTKTMDAEDVTHYEKNLNDRVVESLNEENGYAAKVLEYIGINDLATSYQKISALGKDVNLDATDFEEVDTLCKHMVADFQSAKAECETKVGQLKTKLSLDHLNEKISVFANESKVDATLSDVFRSRDIELMTSINEKEYQSILKAVETEIQKTLKQDLDVAIRTFATIIQPMVQKVGDPTLSVYYEAIIEELRNFEKDLKTKEDIQEIPGWEATKTVVTIISTTLMAAGLAVEAVPVAGQVVGTALLATGALMRLASMLATAYVDYKEKKAVEAKQTAIGNLRALGHAVIEHCRFLNSTMNVISHTRTARTVRGKSMKDDKAGINEAIMSVG